MTRSRRRIKAILSTIDLQKSDDGTQWETPEDAELTDLIELSKVVTHVQFYKDGLAGLWIDFTIGNKSDYYIKIDEIDIELENSTADPGTADAGEGFKREIDCDANEEMNDDYLWNEVIEREELDNSWKTMYDGFDEDAPDEIHDIKGTCQYDRIFFHEAGSGENRQHLICDPTYFTPDPSPEQGTRPNSSRLYHLETMISGKSHCLLPEGEISAYCWAEECRNAENPDVSHRNAATLWVKWDKVDVMRRHNQIEFNFEFGIDSKVGEIKNLYMYYILPQGGEFVGSNSSVEVFQPRKPHWMFGAWFNATEIEKTGPENRVLRSKRENEEFAVDLGKYKLEQRKTANELLQIFTLTLVPALFATLASALITALLFEQDTAISYSVPRILAVMLIVVGIILGYGIYVTILGKYTWASRGILAVAQFIDFVATGIKWFAEKTIEKFRWASRRVRDWRE